MLEKSLENAGDFAFFASVSYRQTGGQSAVILSDPPSNSGGRPRCPGSALGGAAGEPVPR